MGLPVTTRRYLPAGVAAVCYWDEDRYVVLVSPVVRDRLDHGRARREVYRRAREWGHDVVALTFDQLEVSRLRDQARTDHGLRRLLGSELGNIA